MEITSYKHIEKKTWELPEISNLSIKDTQNGTGASIDDAVNYSATLSV